MPTTVHLSERESTTLSKLELLEVHTGRVQVTPPHEGPIELGPGSEFRPQGPGPFEVTGPGRVKIWHEAEGAPEPEKPKATKKKSTAKKKSSSKKKSSK